MTDYQIRNAREEDALDIANVFNASFSDLIHQYGPNYSYTQVTTDDVLKWIQKIEYKDSKLFVIESKKIVGFAHCVLVIEEGITKVPVLYFRLTGWDFGQPRFGILPSLQRLGLGSKLCRFVTKSSWKYTPRFVIAFVHEDNIPATHLLEKIGFRQHELFMFQDYSNDKPLANGSVIASFNLDKKITTPYPDIDVEIRRARLGDEKDISEISKRNVWWNPDTWTIDWTRQFIRGEFSHTVFVAEYQGRVIAVMNYKQNTGEIGFTGVHPDYQRRGVGTFFMTRLLSTMKGAGLKRAIAASGMTQVDAIKLYQRLGFDLKKKYAFVKDLQNDH